VPVLVAHAMKKRRNRAMDLSELLAEIRSLRADVQAIREEIGCYRGFVGGVVWTFSGVAALVGFIWGILIH